MDRRCFRVGRRTARLVGILVWLATLSAAAQEPDNQAQTTGLDALVPVFEVDNRPIKEVLQLLARFSGLNFITTSGVTDAPVTAKMSNVTVKQILDTVLPSIKLAYDKKPGEDFITVMTEAEKEALKGKPEMQTKFFDIKYANIDNIAPVVTQLKSPEGTLYIIPAQNRIIATDYPDRLVEMQQTIRELDVRTIRRVFRLKYINAEEAAKQLEGVLSPNAVIQIDPLSNTLIIEDTPENIAEAEAILVDLDRQRPLMIFEIQYADPAEVIDMIQTLGILTDQAQINYDEGTNKILLQDIPSRVELAQQVIEALDSPPLQIYIEARITDVNLDRLLDISPAYEWGEDVGVGSATDALTIDSQDTLVRFLSGRTVVTDLTDIFGRNFKIIVDVLERDGVLRTISTPFGRVRNHSELYFQDGSEEPYLVRQRRYSSVGGTGDDIFTQRTRSVGRIISVIPHANSSGHVYMVVSVEDSDAQNVVIEDQTLLRVIEKTVETEVDVKTGHTVALGGLIFEKEDRSVSGIPYIKDIPLLGYLFRDETTQKIRRKLVIFITPYVENLEDPFELYEEYVAPSEQQIGEFDVGEFTWDDEAAPPLEARPGKTIELETIEELPEEVRKSVEEQEQLEEEMEWITPGPEKAPAEVGEEMEAPPEVPDATEPGALDMLVPVF